MTTGDRLRIKLEAWRDVAWDHLPEFILVAGVVVTIATVVWLWR